MISTTCRSICQSVTAVDVRDREREREREREIAEWNMLIGMKYTLCAEN